MNIALFIKKFLLITFFLSYLSIGVASACDNSEFKIIVNFENQVGSAARWNGVQKVTSNPSTPVRGVDFDGYKNFFAYPIEYGQPKQGQSFGSGTTKVQICNVGDAGNGKVRYTLSLQQTDVCSVDVYTNKTSGTDASSKNDNLLNVAVVMNNINTSPYYCGQIYTNPYLFSLKKGSTLSMSIFVYSNKS